MEDFEYKEAVICVHVSCPDDVTPVSKILVGSHVVHATPVKLLIVVETSIPEIFGDDAVHDAPKHQVESLWSINVSV